jgi:diaminopimelate decarboxylase
MIDAFAIRGGELYAEGVPLSRIAERFGTPTYVYSRAAITANYRAFADALQGHDHRICYAVKANANLAVLQLLGGLGAGFDIVSAGELGRVLAAGGRAERTVFSGVAKRSDEIVAALDAGIDCFNLESADELDALSALAAARGGRARIAVRVNPDIDAGTHPYIATGLASNKFGLDFEAARAVYRRARAMPGIEVVGIACHIGSQLLDLSPLGDALDRMLELISALASDGIRLQHLDVGGGLGVRYRDETPPSAADWAAVVRPRAERAGLSIIAEPGRAIVADAGVLLTRLQGLKQTPQRRFAIVDAAMNDLLRPALYEAWHAIEPVQPEPSLAAAEYDVVGPVCESGDWLARGRRLAVRVGALLAIRGTGAYGFAMSSQYNARPRAAEVLVDGAHMHLVREREAIEDLWRGEHLLGS